MAYIMSDNRLSFSGADKNGDVTIFEALEDLPRKINCVSIGKVLDVNPDQTVNVSIVYNQDNGNKYSFLAKVPLLVLQGGKKFIKFPVEIGDTCLLLFCDRDISDWHSKGVEGELPPTARMHDVNDAIAICGVNCAAEKRGDLPDSKSKVVQFCGSGNHFVKWKELNEALNKFVEDLKMSLSTTPIAGNGPQLSWTGFPLKIDIEKAKTLSIETE